MEMAKCAASEERNALNLSLRKMHCRIKPAMRNYIIGVTIAHVIVYQRPAWKLAGIINEKWEPVGCQPKKI